MCQKTTQYIPKCSINADITLTNMGHYHRSQDHSPSSPQGFRSLTAKLHTPCWIYTQSWLLGRHTVTRGWALTRAVAGTQGWEGRSGKGGDPHADPIRKRPVHFLSFCPLISHKGFDFDDI